MSETEASERGGPSEQRGRETAARDEHRVLFQDPPQAKYRYTLVITGNSHDEIVHELLMQTRGGYLIDSDYEQRDQFKVYGGRKTSTLEHVNPEQTPENYERELHEWYEGGS